MQSMLSRFRIKLTKLKNNEGVDVARRQLCSEVNTFLCCAWLLVHAITMQTAG